MMMSNTIQLPAVAGCVLLFVAACSAPVAINTVSPHESSCLEAVAETTGTEDVGTLEVIPTKDGVTVMVQVGDAEAPWVCLAGDDAFVRQIYYSAEG